MISLRGQPKLPRDPEKLTVRQMEFIENLKKYELEKLKLKIGKKLPLSSNEQSVIKFGMYFTIISIALIGLTFRGCQLGHNEQIKAFENGYEMTIRPGTASLYWSKKEKNEPE